MHAQCEEHIKNDLFFNCNEKLFKGYICKCYHIFQVVESDSDEDELQDDESSNEATSKEEPCHGISYYALSGVLMPNSIRINDFLSFQEINVLFNMGSTHNFIREGVVWKIWCKFKEHLIFYVMVDNVTNFKCVEVCPDVCL